MKNLIYAAAFLCLLSACTGADPETPSGDSEGYYIYADKNVIEADGKDKASFTIKDQDGKVISTEAVLDKIWYENVETSTRLDRRSTGFTSITDGEFEFRGIYGSTRTLNTVKIKVQNRAKYEVFHKKVAIFKITGTWCQNCPSMTNVLNSLKEDAADHSLILGCHWNDGMYSVLYNETGKDLAVSAVRHVDPSSTTITAPSNIYDLAVRNDDRTVSGITKAIMDRRIESPASTGIRITSVALDGTDLKVTATVKASKVGEYDLTCALLADNVNAGGVGSSDGIYNHMVVAVNQSNFMDMKNDTKFSLSVDGEYTREFTFSFGESVPSDTYLKNLSAAVLSLRKDESGKVIVDNAASCPYGKTVEYIYN